MADSLSKYLHNYNRNLKDKLGSGFTFNSFCDASESKTIKASGLQANIKNEDLNLPWLDELKMVTEKIMAIASNPRSHIKFEKEVRKSEQAVKIDNFDIIETLKVPKFWKQKDGRFLPEYVYTDVYETELAIYENRFIVALVDKMMIFLSQIIAKYMQLIRRVGSNFIDQHVSISDMDIIQDIANFDSFRVAQTENSRRIKKDKNYTLLTTKDSPFVETLKGLLAARTNVSHVLSTPFYKAVKKAKPLSDSDIHITNMLAGDKTYAPCYNFYRKLISLMANENEGANDENTVSVSPIEYHNYVLSNLLQALHDLGFSNDKKDRNKFVTNSDGLITCKDYLLKKDSLTVNITTNHDDHMDMRFEIHYGKGKFNKVLNLKGKRTSLVSIDLVPSTNVEYTSDQELIPYFKKKIANRINSGYTNAFVVTTVDNTQKDDVIICSPEVFKIDANIVSMVQSCITFAEGDNFIYAHLCPVCGYYVDGEQEDGNCYCANCDSVYSLLTSGETKNKKESVWIKRLKNPEKI